MFRRKAMSEKEIENSILEFLAMKNVLAWKVKTTGTFDPTTKRFRTPSKYYKTGQPDISAVLPGGKFLGLEVKSKIGRASANQLAFLKAINEHGGIGVVVRSVDEVRELLNELSKIGRAALINL